MDEVPVVIEAGSDIVGLDELRCIRATCDGRVAPGRHTLKREVLREGEWHEVSSEEIEIDGPTRIRVEGPGILRRTAVITLATGATLVAAGIIVPLVICQSDTRVDPVTGMVRRYQPCDDISDGVKIGWIAGLGIGITLSLLGAVGLATTSGESRLTARRWAIVPQVSLPTPSFAGSYGAGFVVRF